MKVYSLPNEVPFPEPDFSKGFDFQKERQREDQHKKDLEAWLRSKGYTGKYTGKTMNLPAGDGYAQYMLADGRKSFLIHLPYGDAYQSPMAGYMPKRDVLKYIERDTKLADIFASKPVPGP